MSLKIKNNIKAFCILLESNEFSKQKCYALSHPHTKSSPESQTVMANRLANTEEVKDYRKYLNSKRLSNVVDLVKENGDESLLLESEEIEINEENILELLQAELSRVKDPDKRTMLLLRIADFQKFKPKKSNSEVLPTIYLPKRCDTCEFHPDNKKE